MNQVFKILLVDDDDDDRMIFKSVVNEVSPAIEITEALNGCEAMAVLDNWHPQVPDIIFLDLNMPKMDGYSFLKEIKNKEAFKTIPIAIYTTSMQENDIELTYNGGANIFITKPSDMQELFIILEHIFKIPANKLKSQCGRKEFLLRLPRHQL